MGKYIFKEEEISIKGKYSLSGTLATPEKYEEKLPAVLLLPGSGQIDRDGDAKNMRFNTNLYKDLAHLVTSLGFISLRVDKRGVGKSEGNYYETGMWDLVEDIVRSIEFLQRQPHVDQERIILLGHSEGCVLATAANTRKPVDGIILLSGAAESVEEALRRQREILVEEIKNKNVINACIVRLCHVDKKVEKQAAKFMGKVMSSEKAMIKYNLTKVNAKWFREHHQYNVLEDLKKVTCPVLALTGDKDFQADEKKLQRLPRLVKGELEYHSIKDMNHGLKKHEGHMSAINFKKEYQEKVNESLQSEAVEIISSWLNAYYVLK